VIPLPGGCANTVYVSVVWCFGASLFWGTLTAEHQDGCLYLDLVQTNAFGMLITKCILYRQIGKLLKHTSLQRFLALTFSHIYISLHVRMHITHLFVKSVLAYLTSAYVFVFFIYTFT